MKLWSSQSVDAIKVTIFTFHSFALPALYQRKKWMAVPDRIFNRPGSFFFFFIFFFKLFFLSRGMSTMRRFREKHGVGTGGMRGPLDRVPPLLPFFFLFCFFLFDFMKKKINWWIQSLVLPSFTGFYWVLLGFTGFYWVLLGFDRVPPLLPFFFVLFFFIWFHEKKDKLVNSIPSFT